MLLCIILLCTIHDVVNYRQLSEEIASLKKMTLTNQEGNEELTAKLEIKQEYTKRLEDEINQLRILLERQQQQQLLQQRPPSSVSGSMSPRDFNILTGTEENEIDLLVQQMLQAFPTGQEPGKWHKITFKLFTSTRIFALKSFCVGRLQPTLQYYIYNRILKMTVILSLIFRLGTFLVFYAPINVFLHNPHPLGTGGAILGDLIANLYPTLGHLTY